MLKAASIPLVLHDPFFSIWSSSDCLHNSDPVHWSGARQKLTGYLTIDGKDYNFLGRRIPYAFLPQVSLKVTATATEYIFEDEKVVLKLRFTSPLLPDDMVLVSRPCTYVDFEIEKKTAKEVSLHLEVSADLVRTGKEAVIGHHSICTKENVTYSYAAMGRENQAPLNTSADHITIDWGYVYLASDRENAKFVFDHVKENISMAIEIEEKKENISAILAYDDLLSINYFGEWRKAYWTKAYRTIFDAIGAAFSDKEEVLKKAAALDESVENKAREIGGEDYAYLCNMSFRHTIAAHKLITDENGEVIFLSKENDSNGCVGTVDVSYPSVPLFLMFDTEYVKGMLRPVFRFAEMDIWNYDFAPHDVGRYPYAWGQSYGVRREWDGIHYRISDPNTYPSVYPPFYMYPSTYDVYDLKYQMPVEECGNMLIMTAAVCIQENSVEFAKPYWNTLKQWREYLIEFGADPGEQLCTDDFAGHLAHNTNLSVKAIMGIEAYAKLARLMGEAAEAEKYHELAREMAKDWEARAKADDHYMLVFGSPESWSLKYNMVWDKLWASTLFSEEVFETELAYYEKKAACYGVPLDSRGSLTKSDWQLWCVAMSEDKEQMKRLIAPVAKYLVETETRVPFSDWYDTESGRYYEFIARSVQGGIFMPMLRNERLQG
ncbi:MAG: DUF4965 domain-containing protein [Tyzzerella sp.]|nr:DUF4965 domain-containing protein [Tyzzerella sp.]